MNKETIVQNTITEKLTSLIDDMSTNEFLEEVGNKIFDETSEEYTHEELKEMLGKPIHKLLVRLVVE